MLPVRRDLWRTGSFFSGPEPGSTVRGREKIAVDHLKRWTQYFHEVRATGALDPMAAATPPSDTSLIRETPARTNLLRAKECAFGSSLYKTFRMVYTSWLD